MRFTQRMFVTRLLAVLWLLSGAAWAEDGAAYDRDLAPFMHRTGIGAGVLEQLIAASAPLAAERLLPRRIVLEEHHQFASSPGGDNIRMMQEQVQAPVHGGLINVLRAQHPAAGQSGFQQVLSFMGLFDVGFASLSKFEHSTLVPVMIGKGFVTVPVSRSSSMEIRSGLRALEADLTKASDPRIGERWRLFTSTGIALPNDGMVTQDLDMECQATGAFDATDLHNALRGSARRVVCAGVAPNGQPFTRTFAFLEEYQWYLLMESATAAGTRRSTYAVKQVEF